MIRVLPSLLVVALLVACGPDSDQPAGPARENGSTRKTAKPRTEPAPVTGSPMFQKDTEAIARDIKQLEEQGRPSDAAKLAVFEREVRMKLNHIDVTLRALDVSIGAELREIAAVKHKALLSTRMEIDKRVDAMWREISEIQDLLKGSAKGTDEIPAGFTEDELKDRLSDLQESVRSQRGKRIEINAELDAWAKVITGEGQPPERGATTLTEERKILQGLRKRAEALLQS